MGLVFFATFCDFHLCINSRATELIENHFFVMTFCQLTVGWHQNFTHHEPQSSSSHWPPGLGGSCAPSSQSARGHKRKAPRCLEEIAALVLLHKLACPKRSNGLEKTLAEVGSQRYRASASIPTASLHVDWCGRRLVNRFHLDTSNGMLAMISSCSLFLSWCRFLLVSVHTDSFGVCGVSLLDELAGVEYDLVNSADSFSFDVPFNVASCLRMSKAATAFLLVASA